MDLAAAVDATSGLVNYGLAGIIVVALVIPMARYIIKDKERQLEKADAEIVRLRGELADLRRTLDPVAPALDKVGQVMNQAIGLLMKQKDH